LSRSLASLALSFLLVAGVASSEDSDPSKPAGNEGDVPRVELDRLLKLPSSHEYSVEKRGGLTPGEWRGRFEGLREALKSERAALEAAEEDLERIAGTADAWQVGPPMPGAAGRSSETPLDFRIRQTIKRHRQEIERLERQLRDLEVAANLAMVPDSWRE
jgi:hypothetical protein